MNKNEKNLIADFIFQYRREFDFFEQSARLAHSILESALTSSGIRAIVTYRAKRPERLEKKLNQRNVRRNYSCFEDIYSDIVDFSGVRVALYFPAERAEADKIIKKTFSLAEDPIHFPQPHVEGKGYKKRFSGYWATHYRVRVPDASLPESQKRFATSLIEIQVASVLMHSWSEVEHDLVYKPLQGDLSDDEYAILDELNGLVLAGEIALERLQRAVESRVAQTGAVFASHFELASYLLKTLGPHLRTQQVDVALGRVDVLYSLLVDLKLNSPEALAPHVQNIHSHVEKRNISDQIVDNIIANNEELYKVFSNVRKNIHQDQLSETVNNNYEKNRRHIHTQLIDEFTKIWVRIERFLSERNLTNAQFTEGTAAKLKNLRDFRNKIVHAEGVSDAELRAALVQAEELYNELGRRLS